MKRNFLKGVATVALAASTLWMTDGTAHANMEESSTTLQYACEAQAPLVGKVNVPMEVEINALAPEMVSAGSTFTLDESYTNVTILDTGLLKVAANAVEGEVTNFQLHVDEATIEANPDSQTINVAEEGLAIPRTPFPSGNTVTFRVPEAGGVDVGPLIAADEGVVTVSAGNITTVLDTSLGDITASCEPTNDQPVLNKIGIDHVYVPDEDEDEDEVDVSEEQAHVDAALSAIAKVQGSKNNATNVLEKIQLDEGKILPSHQAEKVTEAIELQLHNENLRHVTVEVDVIHPLTTVIGTNRTQQFKVSVSDGETTNILKVHASFQY